METDEFGELDLCLGNLSIKSQILDAKFLSPLSGILLDCNK